MPTTRAGGIEIKSWPELARHGGASEVGGGPGGYYTQEQYKELVTYAANHFVTVVPEIDMPGHTNALLSSYAELNCNGTAPAQYTGTEVGFSALCVDQRRHLPVHRRHRPRNCRADAGSVLPRRR